MTSSAFTLHRTWARPANIGFLGATTPSVWSAFVAAFEQRLRELDWINGSNVTIDYQWAEGRHDRYGEIAQGFVDDGVDVIVTSGTAPVLAAKKATSSIPIVFAAAGDPTNTGLIPKSGKQGNVTGLSNRQTGLAARRLKELRKLVPDLKRLAIIGNHGVRNVRLEIEQIKSTIKKLKLDIDTIPCDVQRASQIAAKIKRLRDKADALYVCTDPFITTNAVTVNISAVSAGLPTMHAFRDYVEAGGLMSCGPDFRAMFGNAADLVDEILRGAEPAELLIHDETATELIINRNTAKALGITIPKGVRRRAKVI